MNFSTIGNGRKKKKFINLFEKKDEKFNLLNDCLFLRSLENIGSSSSSPGDSCKHIRESRVSLEDGEYWIDPEKNGNPLKVFCDMTTDGGKSL